MTHASAGMPCRTASPATLGMPACLEQHSQPSAQAGVHPTSSPRPPPWHSQSARRRSHPRPAPPRGLARRRPGAAWHLQSAASWQGGSEGLGGGAIDGAGTGSARLCRACRQALRGGCLSTINFHTLQTDRPGACLGSSGQPLSPSAGCLQQRSRCTVSATPPSRRQAWPGAWLLDGAAGVR